ncbi:Fcf1-domain-containing protein [Mucidula mucida]|nr:Fcf1-domain-containing protein [Mucidula mucida]
MCKHSVSANTDLVKQLSTVLHGEVKPMITQCCIHELYLQGKTHQGSVDLAKMFERRKCNHREPIPGDECLKSVVGETNKHRYVIASQSQPLRSKLRAIPAVPLVHINRAVMVLEPPSDKTLQTKTMAEEEALKPLTEADQALVGPKPEEPPRKKKKGPKGPNPLSVKKKKPAPTPSTKSQMTIMTWAGPEGETSQVGSGRKRKRRRKGATGDTALHVEGKTDGE